MNIPSGGEGIDDGKSRLIGQARAENRWFDYFQLDRVVTANKAGCKALVDNLSQMFNKYVHENWALKVIKRFVQQQKILICEYKSLGLPFTLEFTSSDDCEAFQKWRHLDADLVPHTIEQLKDTIVACSSERLQSSFSDFMNMICTDIVPALRKELVESLKLQNKGGDDAEKPASLIFDLNGSKRGSNQSNVAGNSTNVCNKTLEIISEKLKEMVGTTLLNIGSMSDASSPTADVSRFKSFIDQIQHCAKNCIEFQNVLADVRKLLECHCNSPFICITSLF